MEWRKKARSNAKSRKKRPKRRPPLEPTPKIEEQTEPEANGSEETRRKKLSRLHRPANMSVEDWQIELRRQFGREQNFDLKNLGSHPLFSEFSVTNPQSSNTYTVQIRGHRVNENTCTCPDFMTNHLGTCKHIEFTLASLEKIPGGEKKLRAGYQPPFSEVYLQYGARRDVQFRPGSTSSPKLARLAANYFGADGSLLPDAFGRFEDFLSQARELEPELRCSEDALGFVAERRDAEQRQRIIAEKCPRGIRSPLFNKLLRVSLYDYQREGVLFAARAGRALLGDEMGLGKTIQGIAVAELMAQLFGVERVLIICPTSLKHQWEHEIGRCCERSAVVVNGLRARRDLHYASDSFFKIINYDTVYRDLDFIERWKPDLVILDEAQRIKNWNTRTARSVKRISSPYALVLTGTPLENRLEELMSIVQFVDRFRLGPTYRLLNEHQIRDDDGKVVGYRDLDRIGKTLEPILLRRHKSEVLDQLPERIDSNIFVPMTDKQQRIHTENVEIVAQIVQKWRRLRFLSDTDQRRLMIALQRMRMCCDSTYLVDHRTDFGNKTGEAITLLDEMLEQPGLKVVIFSQWHKMHELLARQMKDRPWKHVLFHGSLSSNQRKETITQFREDPDCRVFMSTDSGGVGLNLQMASVVINMDLPWNPAVLEQRIGRVHRMGQLDPVRVINFVAQGTIEEGMLSILKFKKSLFQGVLDGGEKEVFLGGSRLNRFMQQVESATAAIPEAMLEDAEDALTTPVETNGHDDAPTGRGGRNGRRRGQIPIPAGLGDVEEETPTPAAPVVPAADPWAALLQNGMAILGQFLPKKQGNPNGGQGTNPQVDLPIPRLQQDEATGETYLRLPMPSPQVIEQALTALGVFLRGMSQR